MALLAAIQNADLESVRRLTDMDGKDKIDPNIEINGYTPIYHAIQTYMQKADAMKKVIQFLVKDIQLNEPGNETKLGSAAKGAMPLDIVPNSFPELKEFLTTLYSGSASVQPSVPEDALITAIESVDLPKVKTLVNSGTIDATKEFEGNTPLYYAIQTYPGISKDQSKAATLKEIITFLVNTIRTKYPGSGKENYMGATEKQKPLDYTISGSLKDLRPFLCSLNLGAYKPDNECYKGSGKKTRRRNTKLKRRL